MIDEFQEDAKRIVREARERGTAISDVAAGEIEYSIMQAMLEVKERDLETQDYEKEFGYPPALAKACWDSFDYALMLRSGTVIYFREARPVSAAWVTLNVIHAVMPASKFRPDVYPEPMFCRGDETVFPRGLDVRVDDIAWVADAPHGS